jgi:hypothetical protein
MKNWKRIAGLAIVVVLSAGSGIAVADGVGILQPQQSASPPADGGERLLANSFQNENTFIPMTPCRILDTRKGYGKLPAGVQKTIDVRGSEATFTTQGGNPGGCSIPASATAIEATVTAIDSGNGFLRAWPANIVQPNATFLNFTSSFNASNTGAITLCGGSNSLACNANQDLNLQAFTTSTHLVIDVGGFYTRKMAAVIGANGTATRSNRVVSSTKLATGQYEVVFDRNLTSCSFQATAAVNGDARSYAVVDPRASVANGVYVATMNLSGDLADRAFYVEVTC